MIKRREFLKTSASAGAAFLMAPNFVLNQQYVSQRPMKSERNFSSDLIEKVIKETKQKIKDPELGWMFENCFPNTLDTTVRFEIKNGKPDTFVITGDIHAMWLRDSSAQVWPYVLFCKQDNDLQQLIAGVINRQTRCILIDPYANAFNYSSEGGGWQDDHTQMKPELHERKWEIDSLCYPIRLAYAYYKNTNDSSPFDDEWLKAMQLVVKTFREQQRFDGPGPYSFMRTTARATDTVPGLGYGNPTKPNGLIHSMFRPSDDACIFPFLIPSNCFAVVSLRQLAELLVEMELNQALAKECLSLANQIDLAIQKEAIFDHKNFGKIFAYEIDGFGNQLFMDDANIPSLLSLPYLGYCRNDDTFYQKTRRFILSPDNPYYFFGKAATGIGSPHTAYNSIWPLAIIMQALTTNDKKEIASCIRMLKNSHAATGFMHESFNKDNPDKFSREWFAWANTLFGELIYKVVDENAALLKMI